MLVVKNEKKKGGGVLIYSIILVIVKILEDVKGTQGKKEYFQFLLISISHYLIHEPSLEEKG